MDAIDLVVRRMEDIEMAEGDAVVELGLLVDQVDRRGIGEFAPA